MKLVTLNTWGGRIHDPLLDFFGKNRDVDIYCLQEIYHNSSKALVGSEYYNDAFNIYSEIKSKLINHNGYFRPSFGDTYGLSIFIKKEFKLLEEGDVQIYSVPDYITGGGIILEIYNG